MVRARGALVHVGAALVVGARDDPALEARADVPAGARARARQREVRAEVLAAAWRKSKQLLIVVQICYQVK